jgi:hypothetical protein
MDFSEKNRMNKMEKLMKLKKKSKNKYIIQIATIS